MVHKEENRRHIASSHWSIVILKSVWAHIARLFIIRAQFCSLGILCISWLSLLGSWNFDLTFWATLLFTCKTALLQLSYFLSLLSAYRSLRVQRPLHFVVSVSLSWNEYNPLKTLWAFMYPFFIHSINQKPMHSDVWDKILSTLGSQWDCCETMALRYYEAVFKQRISETCLSNSLKEEAFWNGGIRTSENQFLYKSSLNTGKKMP